MANRLERFLRVNGIIETSLQKGFLSNINGTMEHIFATSSIVQNALHHGLPLSVTFLDLKNAFGSVSHQLIADMLDHVGVPMQLGSYISSAYSQLSAYVVSKKWSTPTFSIHRGVFQGDTLSPLIFLIAFNPIIQLAQSLSTLGFRLRLPDANQCELPKENSYLYVLWDEESSEEPNGWYLSKVTSISPDGSATLYYRKGKSYENINLIDTEWAPAPGNGKWFLPLSSAPSKGVTKLSASHKVKGFADDISVFSNSAADHAVALHTIDRHCSDLDLTLKPAKCISLVFNGKKMLTTTFPLGSGHTRSITSGHTRFLGCTLGHNSSVTSREIC